MLNHVVKMQLMFIAIAWSLGLPGSLEAVQEKAPKTLVEQVCEKAAKHIKFNFDGKSISYDFPSQPGGTQLFTDLRSIQGISGGGSSRGGSSWSNSLRGTNVNATIGDGVRRDPSNMFGQGTKNKHFVFRQNQAPFHDITLEMDGPSSIDGRVFGGFNGELLRFRQLKNGTVNICWIPPLDQPEQNALVLSGNSFRQLWEQSGNLVDDHVFLALGTLGVATPLGRYDPGIISQLEGRFSKSDSRFQEFLKIARGLDSAEYEIRDQVSKKLAEDFDDWRAQIRKGVDSHELGVSARAELRKVIEKKGDKKYKEMSNLISSMKLIEDPRMLFLLLESASDSTRPMIADSLEKATEQKFGEDVAAWQKYFADLGEKSQVDREFEPVGTLDDGESHSHFEKTAAELAKFARVTVDETGKLTLDRKAWAEEHDGKTIEELADEMFQELDKRKLPHSWLKIKEQAKGGAYGYEHIFVEALQDRLKVIDKPASTVRAIIHSTGGEIPNPNRFQVTPGSRLELRLDPADRRTAPSRVNKKFTLFHLEELRNAESEIWLVDSEEGFRLTLFIGESGTLIDLVQQDSTTCRFVFIQGNEVHSVTAESFGQLWATESEFFKTNVLPLFSRYGIDVSDQLGGPLEHHSQPVQKNADNN